MIRREISLALVFAIATMTPLAGQNARAGSCAAKDATGFLGISGVDCNCTIGSSDPERWAFRTEPRITSLELNTRAGKILKVGDVITHIDGHLITTREGARALAGIKPGQAVVLTVRRGGTVMKFALTAETSCPGDARLGMYAPGRPHGTAPRPAATPAPSSRVYVTTPAAANAPSPARAQVRTRGSFGFGLMCSGNCEIRAESNGALYFSESPEVYSVERGSGADKAGIRRGDVITHVNGRAITTREGGRIFGTARPGQTLRFTVRRGGSSRNVQLTAAPAAAPVAELAKSSEALGRAQQSLRELQQEQQRKMAQIQDEIRGSQTTEQNRVRDMQREFYRLEQEHRRKLAELSTELDRAETRMRAALADSGRATSCAVTTPRPGSRTMRYTGILADTEIEVHGPNPVWVNESGDEVTITAGQTQIKIKKTKR